MDPEKDPASHTGRVCLHAGKDARGETPTKARTVVVVRCLHVRDKMSLPLTN